jgi:hypothetical protein
MDSDVDNSTSPRLNFLPRLVLPSYPSFVIPLTLICLQALLESFMFLSVLHLTRILISRCSILLKLNWALLTLILLLQNHSKLQLFLLQKACTQGVFRCPCRLQCTSECVCEFTQELHLPVISCPSPRFRVEVPRLLLFYFTSSVATTIACSYRAKEPPNILKYGRWNATNVKPSSHFSVCNTPTLIQFNALHFLNARLSLCMEYLCYNSISNILRLTHDVLRVTSHVYTPPNVLSVLHLLC